MSSRSRPVGLVALLGALIALVVGYLNDCFAQFGLSPGTGQPAAPAPVVAEAPAKSPAAGARARVVVQGEQCRLGHAGELRDCAAVCAEQAAGAAVEVEATAGAQRAVEALRGCLQERGVEVQVVAE